MTIASVLLLAVLDSINPSAIVVTLYLLAASKGRAAAHVLVYVGAIFVTYFLLGALLLLGIQSLLPAVGGVLGERVGLVLQTLIGLALLIYSLTAKTDREASPRVPTLGASTYLGLVALGVTVTALELPTAVPYFAAIAIISEAKLPLQVWAPLLAIYNVIFVLPPFALLAGHLFLQKRLAAAYSSLRQRLESGARQTVLWVAGLVGGWLFVTGAIELVARLR